MTWLLRALRQTLRLSRLRRQFPTAVLHFGAEVSDDSMLGVAVVLFSGARVLASKVGAYSYVQAGSTLIEADVGPFCSIASGVTVGLAAHPTSMASTSPVFYDPQQPLPIFFVCEPVVAVSHPRTKIGADVWIGQGALVKAGVTIGVGAVIGAGAIVARDVLPYTIVGGNPCRTIRPRFEPAVTDALLASCWWELDEQTLRQLAGQFVDPIALATAITRRRSGGAV